MKARTRTRRCQMLYRQLTWSMPCHSRRTASRTPHQQCIRRTEACTQPRHPLIFSLATTPHICHPTSSRTITSSLCPPLCNHQILDTTHWPLRFARLQLHLRFRLRLRLEVRRRRRLSWPTFTIRSQLHVRAEDRYLCTAGLASLLRHQR